ncbi:MAG TPA: MlaD family protein [Thermodesulfobacteriota bacterium]|nr:MlaD family protein [Thermodesulfobacteriota bacterium]
MSRKANYYKIGVFVIIGFIIIVAGIIVFGAGKFFRKKDTIETYFDQSVQGLNVGAPLKLKGVPIGSVSDISFVFNHYKTEYNYVLVRAEIYPDMVGPRLSRGGILDEEQRKKLVTRMIQKGLRLELSSQGITGVAFLNMVQLDPERYPKLPIDWKPEYLYIPSSPGTLTLITEAIEDLTQKIGTIDIKAITDKIDQLLTTTNKAVEDAQIATVSQDIQKLLVSLESNSESLHSILEGKEIRQSLKDFARTMEKVNAASEELPRTISELSKSINEINRFTSAQRLHLDAIFEDIKTSSENLRELTDTAKRYPSWVLFGNPPAHLNEVKE